MQKEGYQTQSLDNKDEGVERGVTESPGNPHTAEKQPLLVAHHPTDCKVNNAENKENEDDEEDEIKLAECGELEAEVRQGKLCVRYVKDSEEGWTPVMRRKTSARSESDSSCDLNVDGGETGGV